MLHFDIITIFPSMFDSYLGESILARAQKQRCLKVVTHNLRDFTADRHKTVDDAPYGGGAGMVLKIDPIFKAVTALKMAKGEGRRAKGKRKKIKVILLSAKGKQFTQSMARRFAKLDQIIFVCGRYEGVDERVAKYVADEEVSIGPYVLTGGELPALVLIDAIARHIPGVLGNKESLKEESFSLEASKPQAISYKLMKEYPHYTRPAVFSPKKGMRWSVPKVLLSGDHKKIAEWRRAERDKKPR